MASEEGPDRSLEHRRAWLMGLALLCCYAFFFYRGGNWNVEARNAQIVALAEDHTLAIDPYQHWTGDKAYFEGHFYSDKLIGPSLVAAPVYWASRRLLSLAVEDPTIALMLALRVANVVTNAIPSALLGALLYLFLAEFGLSISLRMWLALTYGLGTLALPYSTALFGHQLGAVCAFGAFMLLWRQRTNWSAEKSFAAGLLIGLGAICDFTTLLVACFLLLYGIWVSTGRPGQRPAGAGQRPAGAGQRPAGAGLVVARAALLALAVAVPLSLQLGANWRCFGSPFTFPHVYHVQPSFQARHAAGLLGVHLPRLYPLFQLTVGPWRGLFFGSPVLLLALPGVFLLGRERRAEALLIGAAWLGVLLMHAGYENWTAGSAYGPRYQIPALPFLILALAPAARRWPVLFKTLATLSIAFTVIVTAHTPFIPEDLRNPLATALGGVSVGQVVHGNLGKAIGLPGILSLLPLVVAEAAFLYALSGMALEEG